MISPGAVALLGFVTLQRLAELFWSRSNAQRLVAAGAIEYGREHYPLMIGFHAVWLAGMWLLGYDAAVQPFFLGLYGLLQIARYWVLATLGRRWTTRVFVVPGEALVAHGPYLWFRHPNYAVVVGEIAVVPLALGMPIFAFLFTIWNAAVLTVRIRAENAALTTLQRSEMN
jgi:methyltransferase